MNLLKETTLNARGEIENSFSNLQQRASAQVATALFKQG
jgi:hypothetical protein